ncbi:MAG: diguanylate cyclase [Ilumatobacter sp.]|uniref:sensor domain-containing protein n=1 Tax=Ilumatobacter sp. TaxID=1967498 RepID=UPI003C74116B
MISRDSLDQLRCVLLEIDEIGNIVDAVGALDRVAGYSAADFAGHHVFEFVAESDHELLAQIFSPAGDIPVNRRPMPFEVTLAAADGTPVRVDVLPTGHETESGSGWVVAMTPRSLRTPAYRLVDRVMANDSIEEVARELVESTSLRVIDDPTQAWVRAFVVMNVGSSDVDVVSIGLDLAVDEAVLHPEVLASFERDSVVGEIQSMLVDDLAEPLRSTALDAGYGAAHIGWAHDGEQIAWWVLWLINDPAFATKMLNADLPRLAALRVADHALERDRVEKMLRVAATTDSLTGLGNRAHFQAHLDATSSSSTNCVLYVDMDAFKVINDGHGHDVGDEVLAEVGGRIASVCRDGDITARIGGDEFAVLLPDTSPKVAASIAARLDEVIRRPMDLSMDGIQVTATIGLAATGDGIDLGTVVREADLQMLARKRERIVPTGAAR